MSGRKLQTGLSLAAAALLALAGPVAADAAKHHSTRHTTSARSGGNGETALTGSALSSAEAAAVAANTGSTANAATTETDSSTTGAAYEVHITKSDGTRAVVIEDASFTVLSTTADSGPGGHGGGPGGHGGFGQDAPGANG